MDSNYLSSNHFIKYNAIGTSRVWSLGREDPPWRREWPSTPVFLLGEFQGQRCLAVYNPCGRKELDMTEQLTLSLHFQGPPWQVQWLRFLMPLGQKTKHKTEAIL